MLSAVLILLANATVPMEPALAEEENFDPKFKPREELVLNDEDSVEEIVFDDSDDDDQ